MLRRFPIFNNRPSSLLPSSAFKIKQPCRFQSSSSSSSSTASSTNNTNSNKSNNNNNNFKSSLKKYWFPMLIPVVVVASLTKPDYMHPTEGSLQSGKWRHVLIPTMFFMAGLSVEVKLMLSAISNYKAHLFIQTSSLIFIPFVAFAFVKVVDAFFSKILFPDIIDEKTGKEITSPSNPLKKEFSIGMIFTGCIPTTIGLSTGVAAALSADVPLTIVNSVLGNMLGILITPFMFVTLTGYQTSMDSIGVAKKLSLTVVLPLILGLVFRTKVMPANIAKVISPYMSPLQQCCILTFLSTVVSQHANTVRNSVKSVSDVAILLAVIFCMYGVVFHSVLLISRPLVFLSEKQRISSLLSGTQKTAAMGVSIIALLFEDDPVLPLVTMPLLMYHPTQVGASTLFCLNAVKRGWMR